MKKIIGLLICVTLIFTFFNGCAQSSTPSSAASGALAASSPAPAGSGEVKLVFAGPFNITSWDPQNLNTGNTMMLNKLLYNTMISTYYSTDGSFTPELATEWSVADDGVTWMFKLRDDVIFHDGEPFDSSAIAMTLHRMRDNPDLVQATYWAELDRVETPDPHTVVVILTQPWGAFLSQLAEVPILSPKEYKELGDAMFDFTDSHKPIGTGPWVAEKWIPGQDVEFLRNDNYWGWGNEKSNVDRLIYRPVIEDTTRIAGIQTGDLDIIDAVPLEHASMLESVKDVVVERKLSNSDIHLGIRCADGAPLADAKARQAASHAIDRELLVNSIIGGGKASSWPGPDTVIGFDPNSPVPEYNVELAKKLLAESSYKGEEISFIAPNGVFAHSKELAQAILAMLTEAGFNVNLEIMEDAAFRELRGAAKYDLFLQRRTFFGGEPDSIMTMRWLNDVYKSGYLNEEMNALVVASKRENDPVKRAEIIRKASQIAWDDMAPYLPLYQAESAISYRSNITGVIYTADNLVNYSKVSKVLK